jgi:hypothetical protein
MSICLLLSCVGVAGPAESDINEDDDEATLFDPVSFRETLLESPLEVGIPPGMNGSINLLPEGFSLQSRDVVQHKSTWCEEPKERVFEVLWKLAGPEHDDSILFSVFPSDQAARKAWDIREKSLPCDFRVKSASELEEFPFLEVPRSLRLFNGSIGPLPEWQLVNGFSDAQLLFGNIIVRSSTISAYAADGANAHAAVRLLHYVGSFLSRALCPVYFVRRYPPADGIPNDVSASCIRP